MSDAISLCPLHVWRACLVPFKGCFACGALAVHLLPMRAHGASCVLTPSCPEASETKGSPPLYSQPGGAKADWGTGRVRLAQPTAQPSETTPPPPWPRPPYQATLPIQATPLPRHASAQASPAAEIAQPLRPRPLPKPLPLPRPRPWLIPRPQLWFPRSPFSAAALPPADCLLGAAGPRLLPADGALMGRRSLRKGLPSS